MMGTWGLSSIEGWQGSQCWRWPLPRLHLEKTESLGIGFFQKHSAARDSNCGSLERCLGSERSVLQGTVQGDMELAQGSGGQEPGLPEGTARSRGWGLARELGIDCCHFMAEDGIPFGEGLAWDSQECGESDTFSVLAAPGATQLLPRKPCWGLATGTRGRAAQACHSLSCPGLARELHISEMLLTTWDLRRRC